MARPTGVSTASGPPPRILVVASSLVVLSGLVGGCSPGPAPTRWARVTASETVFGGAGDQAMHAVAVGADGTVLAGGWSEGPDDLDAALWRSNGSGRWERVDLGDGGGPGVQSVRGIARLGDVWVAAGGDGDPAGGDAAVWVSHDGTRWTRVADDALGGDGAQRINGVAATDGMLVAAGFHAPGGGPRRAAFWLSDDGRTWRRTSEPSAAQGDGDAQAVSVSPTSSGWIATGFSGSARESDGAVWLSTDGVAWRRVRSSAFAGPGRQAVRGAEAFAQGHVVVGEDGARDGDAAVWRSEDGRRWERVSSPALTAGGVQSMLGVTATDDLLVTVGQDAGFAAVWTSTDGVDWRRADIDEPDEFLTVMQSVAAAEDAFVAVGWATSIGGGNATDDRAAVWMNVG